MPVRCCAAAWSFNTQPPEGGWEVDKKVAAAVSAVSTHSRPKAAGYTSDNLVHLCQVSTHSRPKAAGKFYIGSEPV